MNLSPYSKFVILIFLFLASPILAENVSVLAEIERGQGENEPLKGSITITHNQDQTVDTTSFLLGKNKLAATFVKDVKISPNDPLILSIYSFSLPGQKEGLYALPSVSVKVGGTTYSSTMSSYAIGPKGSAPVPSAAPAAAPPQTPPAPAVSTTEEAVKPSLRLEATIDGSNSLYPGQRTKFVYRYYFTGDIALTKETVPLLDAEGFIKIGEKEITDAVKGQVSIRQIAQQVEAVKPGKYTIGPSVIEGYAYKEGADGQPIPLSDKLSSSAPALSITVLPFPEQEKPASFNGAVGQFTFKTALLTPQEMNVGDSLSLEIQITGKGNLANITIPDLCCQPGISGFFRLSDLPPREEVVENTKKIVAEFSPLNAQIKEIPSLEFSFFDPASAQYTVLHSQPIPITVKPGPQPIEETEPKTPVPAEDRSSTQQPPSKIAATPAPIEIESSMPLHTSDLYNRIFGTWWALFIIPLSIFLLIYQKHLRDYLAWQREQQPVMDSKELFQQAFAERKDGKGNFDLLKKSFKLALVEAELIPSKDISDKELPDVGLGKEVKVFCALMDEKLFAGKGTFDIEEIHLLSNELMNKIQAVSKKKSQGKML